MQETASPVHDKSALKAEIQMLARRGHDAAWSAYKAHLTSEHPKNHRLFNATQSQVHMQIAAALAIDVGMDEETFARLAREQYSSAERKAPRFA